MHEIPINILQNKHWPTIKMAPTQNTIPITYESPTTSVPFTMKDADLNTIDMIVHPSPRQDSTSKVVYCQFLFRNP